MGGAAVLSGCLVCWVERIRVGQVGDGDSEEVWCGCEVVATAKE